MSIKNMNMNMTTLDLKRVLIGSLKNMGVDKETTCSATVFLRTREEILLMMEWIRSLPKKPTKAEMLDKVVEIKKKI